MLMDETRWKNAEEPREKSIRLGGKNLSEEK